MVRADAPVGAAGSHVRLDLLVDLEMALFRDDIDLGAGRLFPFGDAGIKRLILLAANQLGLDGHAVEFARQFLCASRTRRQKYKNTGGNAGEQFFHRVLPFLFHAARWRAAARTLLSAGIHIQR